MEHKLVKKILYTGKIKVLTGLYIGGTNAALNIGGPDSFVVRNPINMRPYIPGSSLKGKLRSLIEIKNGCAEVSTLTDSESGKLFGVASKRCSRLIVRDSELIVDDNEDIFKNTDLLYTESKTEVSIDRVTGTASKAGSRTFERVPAGAEFTLNMVLNIFEDEIDDEMKLQNTIETAIRLLHDDYLGGHGSRGYGQVNISYSKTEKKLIDYEASNS
ncbi:MAG: type III-A CRISPR-associated RAMP protein Csm3 [Candidatus Aphodosoma sp.]|nr:type III-A CRISPR-associated RAMP protein Csm3 [Candidatus Aphodosoma sp.]